MGSSSCSCSKHVTGQTGQSYVSVTISGNITLPNFPLEPEGSASSSTSGYQSHTQFDLSSNSSSKSVMALKPKAKAQVEAEDWKPSYVDSRESSVEKYFMGLWYYVF